MIATYPQTRDIVPAVAVRDSSPSTNADLRREAAAHAEEWPHLSVLLTDNQTAGRGRLDRSWLTPPGSALAVSVLLRDLPSSPSTRGWIPLLAGVAMTDAIAAQLPGQRVGVKWPDDVLVDGKKICGILAEVASNAVIVGAGVNTAMSATQLPVDTATSFAVHGAVVDADRLVAHYVRTLDEHLRALTAADDAMASGLHAAATSRCLTLGRQVTVSLPGGDYLRGEARALDTEGRLLVTNPEGEQAIAVGDIVHVRAD